MKTLIVFLLLGLSFLYATNPTDIKTKNGTWINIKIVDSTETTYIIETSSGNRNVQKASILQIVYSPFDSLKESELLFADSENGIQTEKKYPTLKPEYEHPYLLMLPLTFVFGYLGYDYFRAVKDLDKQSKEFEKLGIKTDYKSTKTRYIVGGTLCLIAAITNTLFALKSVKVTGSNDSIGLSYNF